MRQITKIEMNFLPSVLTKDDPLIQHGYFSWKFTIADPDRERKYGHVIELGKVTELPHERLAALTAEMLAHVDHVRGMTPEEIAAADAIADEQSKSALAILNAKEAA